MAGCAFTRSGFSRGGLTSVQADAAIAAVIGGETRTIALAVEGTTPPPPRRLTWPLGGKENDLLLNLIEILKAKGITLDNYKIHLATGINPTPLEEFYRGKFKEWQEGQNNKNFPCDYVLALISLENDRWLFAGVYRILGVKKNIPTGYTYQTELLLGQDDLIGRIVVRYKRQYRASYIWGHKYGQYLEVAEIRPTKVSIQEFPGYDKAVVSHQVLRIIALRKNKHE